MQSLFHEPTEAEWLDVIASELRGRPLDDVLWTEPSPGVRVRGFYRLEDVPDTHVPIDGRPGGRPWRARELYDRSGPLPDAFGHLVVPVDLDAGSPADAVRGMFATGDLPGDLGISLRPMRVTAAMDPEWVTGRLLEAVQSLHPATTPLITGVECDPSLFHPRSSRIARDAFCAAFRTSAPTLRYMTVDTARWADEAPASETGAMARTPVATLARTFSSVSDWLRAAHDAGIPGVEHPDRILIRVETSVDFALTIAYLRSLRLGVQRILEAWSGSSAPVSVHAVLPERTYTLENPESNLVRATTQAVAAIVAGADAVEIPPFDVRTGGSPRGRRAVRALHHLLREEGLLHRVADPAAGSYYFEEYTRSLGQRAWRTFQALEAAGGLEDQDDSHAVVARTIMEIDTP